ncbi:MAG: 2-hydroxy-acid oxidase [Rhodobacterales bacterium 32-66-7]|nr:MAG: 2-hydroxy-acid oxidase [Rhodobacterales bacterium 32-66-7]
MRPLTEADLAEAIAGAAGPLLVRGGGTRTIGHAIGKVLETGGLTGVELYEPGALTLVVRAGTPLAEIEALLATERQRLAFEPPDLRPLLGRDGVSTIGGVVATNASGPRRVQSGACRDSLLGVRFVDGTGAVIKNGGRVMKNVTGYDLVKLLAGSRGTLGVLSEVSLKLQAQPEAEVTLIIEGLGEEDGLQALRQALGSPYDISGAARHSGRSLVRVEGMAGSVAYRSGRLQALLAGTVTVVEGAASATLWREVRDVAPLVGKPGDVWRIATMPTAAADIVARTEGEAVWDWAGGLIWLRSDPKVRPTVIAATAGRGHATLVRGEGGLVFPVEAAEVQTLSAGLRAKFDPKGILNQGMAG